MAETGLYTRSLPGAGCPGARPDDVVVPLVNLPARPPAPALRRAGLRVLALVLVASVLPVRGASPADAAGAEAPKVLRYAMRVAETGFDPAQISDLYSSTLAANMFDALLRIRIPRPAGAPAGRTRRPRCRKRRPTSRPSRSASGPASTSATTRRSRACGASWSPTDYVYSIKRHFDPQLQEPDLHHPQQQPHPRPRRGAPGRAARQEAVRLRRAGRRPARARPLHAPVQARRAEPALHRPAERPGAHRRGRARGGRVLRRQDHGAPGRHRAVPAGRMAAQLADRASRRTRPTATSSTHEEAPRRRPARPGGGEAARRPQAADDRPGRGRASSSSRSRAGWRSSTARWTSSSRFPKTSPTPRSRTTGSRRTSPSRASTKCATCATTRRCRTSRWRTRWSAATRRRRSRCAGRSPSPSTSKRRSASSGAARRSRRSRSWRPGSGATTPTSAARWAPSTAPGRKALLDLYGYVDRDGDGWRDQPDGSPLVLEYATQPDDLNRQLITQWKKNMDAIGIRIVFKTAQWPENLKAVARRQADDVGRRLERRPRRRGVPGPRRRPGEGPGQPRPLRPRRVQPPVPAPADAARRPRAHAGHDAHEGDPGRLHAVQGARAPHLDRPRAAVGRGLPPQRLPARVLALRRHRRGREGAGARSEHGASDSED